jgi:Tol biopolymer transport system component
MGVVWKAVDTNLEREVAIKILPAALAADPERLARFDREAKVLASLNHPNVATVHGFHDAAGVRFLVMELVSGETLEEWLKRGSIPVDEAIPIARKIVEGIEYAHERGIVHRDLKPANVKLTAEGGVKVLDFGLAKAIAGDPNASPTATPTVIPTLTSMGTVAGMILGTAAYMSPEQARGVNIDRRADIWAFGAVFFEMLTGRRAFEGDTISDTLASVLRAPMEWEILPVPTPPGVVRLLKRCLERDPKKRLRDIGEARIALDTIGTEPEAAPASVVMAPRGRPLVPWALFVFAAIAAIVLGGASLWHKSPESPVVRFEVPADAKLARMDWPRLSPDGRRLAFQGFDAGGKVAIWIRPVDSLSAYPLAGTDGAVGRPFWSPDSKYLAYFDGAQLKKIQAAGGPPQTIGEAEFGSDGSWGAGGTIIFDGRNAQDTIRQVAASGGKATPVFSPEDAKKLPNNAWPFFLPDGKHFLFTSNESNNTGSLTIYVGSLGGGDAKRLTPTGSRVEYANGFIVYVLHGTLVAHRFDPDRLELSGDPVPLADHVSENNTRALFSVSTTGDIAYLAGGTADASELVWVDRAGKELGKIGSPSTYLDVALSPDTTKLAYSLRDERDSTLDVWVRDLERDTASRLTFDPADDSRPVFTPDGSKIVFSSSRDGGQPECFVKAANGIGTESLLYKDKNRAVCPESFSSDGRLLTLDQYGAGAPIAVVVVPADGKGEPVILSSGGSNLGVGKLSPDGRFIAYSSNETRTNEVYVQTWPPGGGKWQVSNGGGAGPRWRADGKELFYRTPDFEFFAVPVTLGAQFSAGIPKSLFKRRIVTGPVGTSAWAVAPDGQRILLNATMGNVTSPAFTLILNWPETLRAN